jgi:hypothetical protein
MSSVKEWCFDECAEVSLLLPFEADPPVPRLDIGW